MNWGNYLHFRKKNWEKIRQARKASSYSADNGTNTNGYFRRRGIYRKLVDEVPETASNWCSEVIPQLRMDSHSSTWSKEGNMDGGK